MPKEDCISELTFKEVSIEAIEYSSSMETGYKFAENVLSLTIPFSERPTETLKIEVLAVLDKE